MCMKFMLEVRDMYVQDINPLNYYLCVFFFSLGAAVMLSELAVEAGLPNGVLNIVHGTNVRFSIIMYQRLFVQLRPPLSISICY